VCDFSILGAVLFGPDTAANVAGMSVLLLLLLIIIIILTVIVLIPDGISTHKQYTEYRERNIHNNKEIWKVRAVPRLCEVYPGICVTTEEKHGKTSVRVVEK
jgi:hypothetical protein